MCKIYNKEQPFFQNSNTNNYSNGLNVISKNTNLISRRVDYQVLKAKILPV